MSSVDHPYPRPTRRKLSTSLIGGWADVWANMKNAKKASRALLSMSPALEDYLLGSYEWGTPTTRYLHACLRLRARVVIT